MKLSLSIMVVLLVLGYTNAYRMVCYYSNLSAGRPGNGKFTLGDIDTSKCTHLIYGNAFLDPTTLEMVPSNYDLDVTQGNYVNFNKLKNANLKTMLSLGGWGDSNTGDFKYSSLVSTQTAIDNFVAKAVQTLIQYDFDGLDIDWEFPTSTADRLGFTNLLATLRTAFNRNGLVLSAAVSIDPQMVDASYDVPQIIRSVDFLNLMAYDIHGTWEADRADHHAPLSYRPWDNAASNTVDRGVQYWIAKSGDRSKLNMGIAAYGRSWRLINLADHMPPAPANGGGAPGIYVGVSGVLGYNELCLKLTGTSGWSSSVDPVGSPYAWGENDWVGYEDAASVQAKTDYIKDHNLGGAMVFEITLDDFRNDCGGGKSPILSAVAQNLNA